LNTRHANIPILVMFLSVFFLVLITAAPAKSETGNQDARFTSVTYNPRILAQTTDIWTFSIHNANCPGNGQNASQFFLIMYLENVQWLNEYNDTQYRTWSCSRGNTVTRNFKIEGWLTLRPTTYDLRVELYWNANGTAYLEDTTSFTIAVMVHISLQNILATSYFVAYLIACLSLFSYDYVLGLEE
jgi:hypothetical protein